MNKARPHRTEKTISEQIFERLGFIEAKQDNAVRELVAVREQITKINSRVFSLERAKWIIYGGGMVVIAISGYLFNSLLKLF